MSGEKTPDSTGVTSPLPWEPWGSQHPLTLQSSPACDIADVVVGQDGAGRRQAAQLDLVSQGDRAGQFEQGNVVPGLEKKQSITRGLTGSVPVIFLILAPAGITEPHPWLD